MILLVSFQNGFFWKVVFDKQEAKELAPCTRPFPNRAQIICCKEPSVMFDTRLQRG
jgi:hypothetical protein